jgi:hypothetical protein
MCEERNYIAKRMYFNAAWHKNFGVGSVIQLIDSFVVVRAGNMTVIPMSSYESWFLENLREYLARPIPEPVEHKPDLEF